MFATPKNRPLLVSAILVLSIIACVSPSAGRTVESSTQAIPTEPAATTEAAEPTPYAPIDPIVDETGSISIEDIVAASVQIYAADTAGRILWTGSGTMISPTGEILTNCHVACEAPVLVIAVTDTPDLPPEERYIAEIRFADQALDLALIQIVADINGNAISPTDLPALQIGDSSSLSLGDPVRIFGYPGVGGETITFTSGSVSGFQTQGTERIGIKTDADIASGNSGGTAVDAAGRLIGVPTLVNPDVRDGVTIGGIGLLRPVNLVAALRQQAATPPTDDSMAGQPDSDPGVNEPNDTTDQATGPLEPGATVQAYISWARDYDIYYIDVQTTQRITVSLTDIPGGTDYDLYLAEPGATEPNIIDFSEAAGAADEFIEFTPGRTGRFYIAIIHYEGSDAASPYTLTVTYDGGSQAGPGGGAAGIISITGRVIDGQTSRPLSGGQFGIIDPAFSCRDLFAGSAKGPNEDIIIAIAETNGQGLFTLVGVPENNFYSVFFIFGNDYVCTDDWLEVPPDAIDSDLGDIPVSF
ncbi:MAG: serine protease [Anaerolineae bacterium]